MRELKEAGHFEEAERVLKGVGLELDKMDTPLVVVAAEIEFEIGNYDMAAEYAATVRKRGKTSVQICLIEAYSCTLLERAEHAIQILGARMATELNRYHREAPRTLSELFAEMTTLRTVTHAQIGLLNCMGFVLRISGRRYSAASAFALTTHLYPHQKEMFVDCLSLRISDLGKAQNDLETLLNTCDRANKTFPKDLDIFQYYLRALQAKGSYKKIIEVIDEFVKENKSENPEFERHLILFKVNALFDLKEDSAADALLDENPDVKELDTSKSMLELIELGRLQLRTHGNHTGIITYIINTLSKARGLESHDYDMALAFTLAEYKNIPAAIELLDHVLETRTYHVGYKTMRATLAAQAHQT